MKKFILFFLFLLQIFIFTKSKVFNQNDSIWNSFVSLSIVKHFDFNLNEYHLILKKTEYINLVKKNNQYYNYYPFGISILVTPFLYFANLFDSDLESKMEQKSIKLDKLISAILISFSSILFFLICFEITSSNLKSLFLLFLFSFCTLNFSVLTRGLWQHTGLIFLYSILFYLILKEKNLFLISIILFCSYAVRPTSLLYLIFISVFLVFKFKKINFLFLGFIVLGINFYLNFEIFGNFIHPYYDFNKVSKSDRFMEAFLGNLISPSRGIFIYSPIFLFSFIGIYFKKKFEFLNLFDYSLILISISHLILISRNLNWWGGHSFGYRLMSDLIPVFIYFLIYYLKYVKINFLFFLFSVLTLISLGINLNGANNMNTYLWNLSPNNIDSNPERNWDYKDLQFLK